MNPLLAMSPCVYICLQVVPPVVKCFQWKHCVQMVTRGSRMFTFCVQVVAMVPCNQGHVRWVSCRGCELGYIGESERWDSFP